MWWRRWGERREEYFSPISGGENYRDRIMVLKVIQLVILFGGLSEESITQLL